jgi:penicillin-binding protein 1A
MQKAVLAAEDADFYEHGGIDFSSILRAFIKDLTHQATRQGGSTITQQLARNLFLTRERTLSRKVKEAVLAVRMERTFSKDQILEMYLNTIYFGHGTYGIGSAEPANSSRSIRACRADRGS